MWTREISSLKVDPLKPDATVKAVEDYVGAHPPHDISEMARILQATQICYQEMTKRELKPSVWKERILKKIADYEDKVKLLKRVRALEKLSTQEKRETKKVMPELNMLACLKQDTSKAIETFNERIAIYLRKLEVADRRREYRRQNQSFDLYRSNFYRKLGGANEVTQKWAKKISAHSGLPYGTRKSKPMTAIALMNTFWSTCLIHNNRSLFQPLKSLQKLSNIYQIGRLQDVMVYSTFSLRSVKLYIHFFITLLRKYAWMKKSPKPGSIKGSHILYQKVHHKAVVTSGL